jgi:hypothetical protein
MRVADVWTAGGLRFCVLLDRALDVHAAEHAGRPLAWVHPDLAGPEQFDPEGYGWLKTFGGGLVTTCGLKHYGQPEKGYGLHGRISHTRGPRDEIAAAGLDSHRRFDTPRPDAPGQVFFHDPPPGLDGRVRVAIVNCALAFGAFLSYRAAELPCLTQWKRLATGDYVCALEPGTNWEAPRRQLEAEGRLRRLAPGEEIRYDLEIGALPSAEAIEAFEREQCLDRVDGRLTSRLDLGRVSTG